MLRDCLSGEILLAKSLLSSTAQDLAGLIDQVRKILPVPITGVVSDSQESIRNAVAMALKGVPISYANSTTYARRPSRSTRRIATPRRS